MVRRVVEELFHDGPDGLCGNEDMGQMSAWYIFSTLGLYPATPGLNVYLIGSPVFAKATVHLDRTLYGDATFTIEARNCSRGNIYIQSATLNGRSFNRPWLDHAQLRQGGTLMFVMGPQPKGQWGSAKEAAPPGGMTGN